jgi:hypothetical protein
VLGHKGVKGPEAQAFILEMYAAWKDWESSGGKRSSKGMRCSQGGLGVLLGSLLVGMLLGTCFDVCW